MNYMTHFKMNDFLFMINNTKLKKGNKKLWILLLFMGS